MDDDLVSVGRPLRRLASARPLDERRVQVKWRGGDVAVIDLMPALASHRTFIRLRDDDKLFKTVKVNEDGNALEWDDGAELSAEWIERIPPVTMTNAEFRAAMDDLELSLDGMAAMLGTARRMIASYRKDKQIPNSVALATRFLVERKRKVDA